MTDLFSNEGKNVTICVSDNEYARIPVKTHVITNNDDITDVVQIYLEKLIEPEDIIFISEKCVACSQSRAIPIKSIKPRRLAKLLSKFVYKSPYGIGLSMPETMEMALQECGVFRILFASFVSALGKMAGKRGLFYVIAGSKARSIDGPTPNTIAPYNEYVVLEPNDPDEVAKIIAFHMGVDVCIVDINDLGGNILGVSSLHMDKDLLTEILKDNPLGQSGEQTPMGIIRKL